MEYLVEFLIRFAPDESTKILFNKGKEHTYSSDMLIDYLPDAIQNFADMICEKQRENCVDDSILNYCREYNSFTIDLDSIRNAKQPKIDEL